MSFGDVTYADPSLAASGTTSPNGTQGAPAAPEEVFDLNDPRLTSEALNINPNADAFASPPVLPDGKWRAKLRAQEVKGPNSTKVAYSAKRDKDGNLYLYTALESEVIDHQNELFDGIKLSDYFVDSRVGRNGASRVSTLIVKLGQQLASPATHKAMIEQLLAALAGEPELGIETAWEADCQACGEIAERNGGRKPRSVRGMFNFPQVAAKDDNGRSVMRYTNQLKCPVNPAHGPMFGRPRIIAYLSLEELKKFGK